MTLQSLQQLRRRWDILFATFAVPSQLAGTLFEAVASRYAEPHRHYHTLDHIAAMFATLNSLDVQAAALPALELAVWYHDVVYDPRAADNEEQSAAFAGAQLRSTGIADRLSEEITRLILLTKSHRNESADRVGQLLLDSDLAVLGAATYVYDRYAAAIRQEYAWMPEDQYRAGRAQVLQRFLHRPRIYCTDQMFRLFEAPSRANLLRECASLQ